MGDNADLVHTLLSKHIECSLHPYIHHLAVSSTGVKVCYLIVNACASLPSSHSLLNDITSPPWDVRPLNLAIRNGNTNAIVELLGCSKVDIHLTDVNGMTCIETAINDKNIEMLELLIKMRRNDVLEKVLHVSEGESEEGISLLIQLQQENIRLANALGYTVKKIEDQSIRIDNLENDNLERENNEDSLNEMTISNDISLTQQVSTSLVTENMTYETEISLLKSVKSLAASDQILKILITAIKESGICSEDFHAHICFSQGLVYREYCIAYVLTN